MEENKEIMETPKTPKIIEVPVETSEVKPEVVDEVKTSGTTTEEELIIDASKPETEILDEYEIKKDLAQEQKKYKRNITFIIIVILFIVLFIVFMPYIVKKIGL